jgi:hypothetical protein
MGRHSGHLFCCHFSVYQVRRALCFAAMPWFQCISFNLLTFAMVAENMHLAQVWAFATQSTEFALVQPATMVRLLDSLAHKSSNRYGCPRLFWVSGIACELQSTPIVALSDPILNILADSVSSLNFLVLGSLVTQTSDVLD